MDCSGFVDWVFYNASDGESIISHGGGAAAQHSYCLTISWDEAMPGDLVFYPDDEHVGIVAGRDEDGDLLIIHCASGYNNIVITSAAGFTSIARPLFY
jgi:cell wall-associated NlpC family hydrolase